MRKTFGLGRLAAGSGIVGPLVILLLLASLAMAQPARPPVRFNTSFPGASLGKVEVVGEDGFRCHVEGQYDERGHNRQPSWFFFRMDGVKGRDITLTLTDLVGEYNDRPGAVPAGPDIFPVFSDDGETWRHFPTMEWDAEKKEATLRFRPAGDTIWIAHQPPYTPDRLRGLLAEVERFPHVRVETIGKTVGGRDLHLVTVTDWSVPDAGKKRLWLQARQHAWESGTSYVMEGALRFVSGDDPAARELRRKVVFSFLPMADPDGSAAGKVRFNANGYDVNRHWSEVDLRSKAHLTQMPEIWYTKKALFAEMDAGRAIDLLVNLHNTETGEYIAGAGANAPEFRALIERFAAGLAARTMFHASRAAGMGESSGSMTGLWGQKRIPVLLMELRIGTNQKLGRRPTVADRLLFGRQLVEEMAAAVGVENR